MVAFVAFAGAGAGAGAFVGAGASGPAVAAGPPAFSREAQRRLLLGPFTSERAAEMAERARLLTEAEGRLQAGDAAAAEQAFDRAALLLHAADTELGLVRTYMQAGAYRRALAFAAHAAGAHRELPGATALYAWLLHAGAQGVVARRQLTDALQTAPQDAALRLAAEELARPWPRPSGPLAEPPLRAAPYGTAAAPAPAGARVVGSATLSADGQAAWAPAALLAPGARVWVRNGLGELRAARVPQLQLAARSGGDHPVVRLLLDRPLEPPSDPSSGAALTARAPFAGSPAFVLAYAADTEEAAAGDPTPPSRTGPGEPAWPLLRQGFFGREVAPGQLRRIDMDIDAPTGSGGGPVFDRDGRWAGIALPGAGGTWQLRAVADLVPAAESTPGPLAARATPDLVFERGLRSALQLIVLP